MQIGLEPTSSEEIDFTERRANQLLNYTNCAFGELRYHDPMINSHVLCL